jgi:hypothetical protein
MGKEKDKNGKLIKNDDGYYVLNIDKHGRKIGRHLRLLNKKKNTKFKVVWISPTNKVVSNVLSFTQSNKPVKQKLLKTFAFRRDNIEENPKG